MLRSGQTPGLGRLSRKSVDLDFSALRMDGIRHAHSSGGFESFVGHAHFSSLRRWFIKIRPVQVLRTIGAVWTRERGVGFGALCRKSRVLPL